MKKYLFYIVALPFLYQKVYSNINTGLIAENILQRESSVELLSDSPTFNQHDSTLNDMGNISSLKWYTMFQKIPGDWVQAWKVTVSPDNLPTMAGITALTVAMIATDRPVWERADDLYRGSRTARGASDFFVYLGDGRPQFGLSLAFATYGFAASDNRALLTASQITEVILSCGTVVQVLKHITGRESPIVSTRRNGRWKFFPNQLEYHRRVPHFDAFPSGHIATSLATLTVILENYPETKPWLQPLGYTIVSAIGISLVNKGIHWWSDFPLGIYLGYHFGKIVSHPAAFSGDKEQNESSSRLIFTPSISPWGNGLGLSYTF